MDVLRVFTPFLVAYAVTFIVMVYLVQGYVRERLKQAEGSQRAGKRTAKEALLKIDWVNVIFTPILVGLVVEVVWWGIALVVGVSV